MTALRQFMFFGRGRRRWPRARSHRRRAEHARGRRQARPQLAPTCATGLSSASGRPRSIVTYVTSALTRGSVLSLIDAGGMGVGVGEWRPEKDGDFGTYAIDQTAGRSRRLA